MAKPRVSVKGMGAELFFGPADGALAEAALSPTSDAPPIPAAEANLTTSRSMPAVPAAVAETTPDEPVLEKAQRSTASRTQLSGIPGDSSNIVPAGKHASMQALEPEALQAPGAASSETGAQKGETSHKQVRRHASMTTVASRSADALIPDSVVEAIRRVVKFTGKETGYVRLTPEEKGQVTDILYNCKRKGYKTSENEIYRVALNFLFHDYHEHGDASLLARVLASLLA